MNKKTVSCDICHRKIFFLNPKVKRSDDKNICIHCAKKFTLKHSKTYSFDRINLLIKELNLKNRIIKEQKHYRKNFDFNPKQLINNDLFFNINKNKKLLRYYFKNITFLTTNDIDSKKYSNSSGLDLVMNQGDIFLSDNNVLIGKLYEGTLKNFLLKIMAQKKVLDNYEFEVAITYKDTSYFEVSIGIYKTFVENDWSTQYLFKTNIVKTNNNDIDKQKFISKMNIGDIVYISNESTSITTIEDIEIGQMPLDAKKKLKNCKNIIYIGIVDQIYRCYNGLKTFDIKVFPVMI